MQKKRYDKVGNLGKLGAELGQVGHAKKNDMRKVRILRIPTIISANFYEGQKRTMLEREGTKKEQVKMVACTNLA